MPVAHGRPLFSPYHTFPPTLPPSRSAAALEAGANIGASGGLPAVAAEVAAALDRVAELTEADLAAAPSQQAAGPAPLPQRFASALAAREPLSAAASASGGTADGTTTMARQRTVSVPLIVTDPTTIAYWRYCKARGSSRTTLLGRKLAR